jgi:hypothetical protein
VKYLNRSIGVSCCRMDPSSDHPAQAHGDPRVSQFLPQSARLGIFTPQRHHRSVCHCTTLSSNHSATAHGDLRFHDFLGSAFIVQAPGEFRCGTYQRSRRLIIVESKPVGKARMVIGQAARSITAISRSPRKHHKKRSTHPCQRILLSSTRGR